MNSSLTLTAKPASIALIALLSTIAVPRAKAAQDPGASRIYGGEKANSCEWPTTIGFGSCTGTLVHPHIVLYAAHCGSQRKVSFGDAYRNMASTVTPKFCKTNPEYKGNGSLGKGVDFAYCYLEKAVTDFPTTPIAYGCELDEIKAGTKVWLVGFGDTDSFVRGYGTKHKVETEIQDIVANGNELKVGGNGKATCYGDSGGPAFTQLSDGTWRSVGISSFGYGECGQPSGMTFSQAAVPWIQRSLKEQGIDDVDLLPCYDDEGKWEPTKECTGFATEPGKAHGSWDEMCGGEKAPRSGPSSICGDPFGDDEPPKVKWVTPKDQARFEVGEDIVVEVEASDNSGDPKVQLLVDDEEQKELKKPPYKWTLSDLEPGEYTLLVKAKDASQESESEAHLITVEKAEDDTENGDDTSASSEDDSSAQTSQDDDDQDQDDGQDKDNSGDGDSEEDSSGDAGANSPHSGGCGCSTPTPPSAFWSLTVLLFGINRRNRRRR